MKSEETLRDANGREIHPGDLFRSPHFIGARRKRHYLYHTIVEVEDRGKKYLRMVPTCHLEPTKSSGGGDGLLTDQLAAIGEVISGAGRTGKEWWDDRPRIAALNAEQKEKG